MSAPEHPVTRIRRKAMQCPSLVLIETTCAAYYALPRDVQRRFECYCEPLDSYHDGVKAWFLLPRSRLKEIEDLCGTFPQPLPAPR